MTDLVTKVKAIIGTAEALGIDMAAELVIDVVLRGMGRLGGRPKKPVTNGLGTGSEPVTNPFSSTQCLPASSRDLSPDLEKREKEEDPDPETENCSELPPFALKAPEPDRTKLAPDPPPDTVMIFPTVGKGPKEWHLRQAAVDRWRTVYPDLDVVGECGKARIWCEANRAKRKTAAGMEAFLVNWLSRAQNSGAAARARASPARDVRVGHVRVEAGTDYGPEGEQSI